MSQVEIPADILALPIADRIEIVAKIWDSIEDNSEFELSDEHRRILDERLAAHRANPTSGTSWDVLKNNLLGNQ